jgi:hypothetical protein
MSKLVSSPNAASGHPCKFSVSDADWKKILTLKGSKSGKVALSNGSAQVVDDIVTITQPSPGGARTYDFAKKDLYK